LASADGALGFLLGHVPDEPPVFGSEEGAGAAGVDGGLAERSAEGLPRPVALLPLRLPAEEVTCGQRRAQEHRCPAVGKTLMSVPVSAMMSCAVMIPNPGMASS